VIARELPEVERGLGHLEIDARHRRKVLDEEHRKPLGGDLVHGAESESVSVGEREPFVDPGAAREALGVQLAGRQHDLAVLAVDEVPVVVHRDEVVVRPDLLQLPECVQQGLVVPERHVPEGGAIVVDGGACEDGVAGELALLHLVERERGPRGRDVVGDERSFLHLLVGRDHEALHDGGVERSTQPHREIEAERSREQPVAPHEGRGGGEERAHDRRRYERAKRGNPGVDIDVRSSLEDPRRAGEEIGYVEPRAQGEHQEKRGRERRQMPDRGAVGEEALRRVQSYVAREHVNRHYPGDRKHHQPESRLVQELEKRESEDVKADVPTEDGVGLSEWRPVPEEEPVRPA